MMSDEGKRTASYYELINHDSLMIFDMIKKEHDAFEIEFGVGNLVNAFFHELMVFYTGCLGYGNREGNTDDCKHFDWPFVSPKYVLEPNLIGEREWESIREKQRVNGWRQLLARGVLPVSYGASIPFGHNVSILMRYFLTLTLKRESTLSKVYVPNLTRQLEKIRFLLIKLNEFVGDRGGMITVDNWVMHISGVCTEKQRIIKGKGILLGTRANLLNRIYAINYLQQEKNVIGFTHGEINNTVLNEPIVGYADRSLCTTLVDYGVPLSLKSYNRALVNPHEVVARKSTVVERIFIAAQKNRTVGNRNKVLYIPTLYSGCRFYGPFRQLHDDDYLAWQRKLMRAVTAVYGDVYIKLHPKSMTAHSDFFDQLDGNLTFDNRQLEDCIQEYDLLVLDYYSTAMTIAIATSKPIVYFDIGLRNLSVEFRQLLSNRAIIRDVDPLRVDSDELIQILEYEKGAGEMFENKISERFSIEGGERFNFMKLVTDVVIG